MHGPGGIGMGTNSVATDISRVVTTAGQQMAGGQTAANTAENKGAEDTAAADNAAPQDSALLTGQDPNAAATPDAGASPDTADLQGAQGNQGTQDTGDGTQTNYQGGSGGQDNQAQAQDNNAQFLNLGRMVRGTQTQQAGTAAGASRANQKATEQKAEDEKAATRHEDAEAAKDQAKAKELFQEAQQARADATRADQTQDQQGPHKASHGGKSIKEAKAEVTAEQSAEETLNAELSDGGGILDDMGRAGIRSKDEDREAREADGNAKNRELEEHVAALAQAGGGAQHSTSHGGGEEAPPDLRVDAASGNRDTSPQLTATLKTLAEAHPQTAGEVNNGVPSEIHSAAAAMLAGQNPGIDEGKVPKAMLDLKPIPDAINEAKELTPILGVAPPAASFAGDASGAIEHISVVDLPLQMAEA